MLLLSPSPPLPLPSSYPPSCCAHIKLILLHLIFLILLSLLISFCQSDMVVPGTRLVSCSLLFPRSLRLCFLLLNRDKCLQRDLTWPLLEMACWMSEGVRVKWSAGASNSLHRCHCFSRRDRSLAGRVGAFCQRLCCFYIDETSVKPPLRRSNHTGHQSETNTVG